jgi:sterol desaturase/sphingolipid hydroxylase (fatty acid hydroxylase superfamily)
MSWIASFLAALLVTSFVEYAVHRLMHAGVLLHAHHAAHHRDGWGQGFWLELRDYLVPGLLVMLPSWFFGTAIGTGWTLGCISSAVFIAYAHQLQHDNPLACRWMRIPVHYVHHRDQMWHHNFGLSVDWWDRLLGTYKVVPFGEEFPPEEKGRGPFAIHWRAQDEARAAERVQAARERVRTLRRST